MKVPKYIEQALIRRSNAAKKWNKYDCILGKFIVDNDIEVDTADYYGGVEGIASPYESSERILIAILNKEVVKK